MKLCRYLINHADPPIEHVYGVASGSMAPVLLHAAAFDDIITKAAFLEPYLSYQSIVMNKFYDPDFVHSTVAGALTVYDLPDLAAALAPRPVLLVNITDQNGQPVHNQSLVKQTYEVAYRSYRMKNAEESYTITRISPYESYESVLQLWLDQE